jgi:hypothetical protein
MELQLPRARLTNTCTSSRLEPALIMRTAQMLPLKQPSQGRMA